MTKGQAMIYKTLCIWTKPCCSIKYGRKPDRCYKHTGKHNLNLSNQNYCLPSSVLDLGQTRACAS
jgi:hypothetical protein